MRTFLAGVLGFICAGLLVSAIADAQFAPPTNPTSSATVGFWAAGKTAALSASTTSNVIALSVVTNQVQVYNATAATAFVQFGNSRAVATVGSGGTSTSDYPIAPGAVVVVSVPAGATFAAGILSTGTGLIYFTPGSGL
jgi:type IV secretory pathway protease TraF